MTTVLQLGNRTIAAEQVMPLLSSYQMLPQLLRESIIDQAIAPIECTPEEIAFAYEKFYQQNQLISETQRQTWLERYCMNQPYLEELLIVRLLKIEKFKLATWGHKLESYFLKRKGALDQVVYSLILTKDKEMAQELYFRIQEREQTFAELAYEYSQGPEAESGGIIGPIELGNIHPNLAQLLSVSQPGQLWPPRPLGECLLIVRLEKLIPAQLNESMRQRLLRELFEAWLQEHLSHF
ncbi:peptidylprolyl isomerase [Microseira wollei]|uniref:peptidylprolyl isomerase n=1 Tax=Microseira wollei NIES-4236 TaxID=2530354 RepID=A0AAV3X5Q9_9CYAN|nr:peptidylprolyl isomerase [Microseira wollei]GET36673.1 PpiC-type peptidyl-prolyl cis-trans isomerase [Microseira wollei NIES-4236]